MRLLGAQAGCRGQAGRQNGAEDHNTQGGHPGPQGGHPGPQGGHPGPQGGHWGPRVTDRSGGNGGGETCGDLRLAHRRGALRSVKAGPRRRCDTAG
ncbi:hypothetical protein C2U72_07830 [Prosthecomicrobium hirschii]|nr:hypothetical protein C2U72_07830 [Prosthecomicrobium hirschii]